MTAGPAARPSVPDKLKYLAETVQAEAALLAATDGRLFAEAMSAERAAVPLLQATAATLSGLVLPA